VDRLEDLVHSFLELPVGLVIVLVTPREIRWNCRVRNLGLRTGSDADPGNTVLFDGREQDDIVDGDKVRVDLLEGVRKPFLGPLCGIDDRLPTLRDVVVNLLVRRSIEVRDVLVYEVVPVPGFLFFAHVWVRHIHVVLLEPVVFEQTAHRRVRDEHRLVTEFRTLLCDTDRVETRSVRLLGEERNRLTVAHSEASTGTVRVDELSAPPYLVLIRIR